MSKESPRTSSTDMPIEKQNTHQITDNKGIENRSNLEKILADADRCDTSFSKTEIYKWMQEIEKKWNNKLYEASEFTTSNLLDFSNKINELYHKVDGITNTTNNQKVKVDKIDDFEGFKRRAEDQWISLNYLVQNAMKAVNKMSERIDSLYKDNLTVPGFVGLCSKYPNMGAYIASNIEEVQKLVDYRDKTRIEMKDVFIELKSVKDQNKSMANTWTTILEHSFESKLRNIREDLDSREEIMKSNIRTIQMNNCKYAIDLKKQASDLSEEWIKVLDIKNDIYTKWKENMDKFKSDAEQNKKNCLNMKIEFSKIKERFDDMVNSFKDNRFRSGNLTEGAQTKKKEFNALTDKRHSKRWKSIELMDDPIKEEADWNSDINSGKKLADLEYENLRETRQNVKNFYADEQAISIQQDDEDKKTPLNDRLTKNSKKYIPGIKIDNPNCSDRNRGIQGKRGSWNNNTTNYGSQDVISNNANNAKNRNSVYNLNFKEQKYHEFHSDNEDKATVNPGQRKNSFWTKNEISRSHNRKRTTGKDMKFKIKPITVISKDKPQQTISQPWNSNNNINLKNYHWENHTFGNNSRSTVNIPVLNKNQEIQTQTKRPKSINTEKNFLVDPNANLATWKFATPRDSGDGFFKFISNNNKDILNVEIKTMEIGKRSKRKRFKTTKENPQVLKSCFGSTINSSSVRKSVINNLRSNPRPGKDQQFVLIMKK